MEFYSMVCFRILGFTWFPKFRRCIGIMSDFSWMRQKLQILAFSKIRLKIFDVCPFWQGSKLCWILEQYSVHHMGISKTFYLMKKSQEIMTPPNWDVKYSKQLFFDLGCICYVLNPLCFALLRHQKTKSLIEIKSGTRISSSILKGGRDKSGSN